MADDTHDRLAERERGRQAKQILDNPLWEEAWSTLDSVLVDGWRRSQSGDVERRELIYSQLRAAERVRAHIESVFQTGQMAEMQLKERSIERRE